MKIALIGPGIMPIPPKGWGAVEILIWDYYCILKRNEFDVTIINNPNAHEVIHKINNEKYDVVHIHYDVFCGIIPHLYGCKKILVTSHYPYIEQCTKHKQDHYVDIFNFLCDNDKFINVTLCKKDYDVFHKRCKNKNNLKLVNNSINHEKYFFEPDISKLNGRTICLGKIEPRKRQYLIQHTSTIDFVGPIHDVNFETINVNYLGEWSKEHIYNNLTKYTNLILVSEGEADPLVVKEALICGLNIFVTRKCCENLDINKPFITIIEEDVLLNNPQLSRLIDTHNKKTTHTYTRDDVRVYGIQQFSMSKMISKYIDLL